MRLTADHDALDVANKVRLMDFSADESDTDGMYLCGRLASSKPLAFRSGGFVRLYLSSRHPHHCTCLTCMRSRMPCSYDSSKIHAVQMGSMREVEVREWPPWPTEHQKDRNGCTRRDDAMNDDQGA